MKAATPRRAWSLVMKRRRDSSSHSMVELKLSEAALSSALTGYGPSTGSSRDRRRRRRTRCRCTRRPCRNGRRHRRAAHRVPQPPCTARPGPAGRRGGLLWRSRQTPRRQVQHRGQVQFAFVGGDLGQVPAPPLIHSLRGEVPFHQVRDRFGCLVGAGQRSPFTLRGSALETLAGHRSRHRVHRHLPTGLDPVLEHPRRPVR